VGEDFPKENLALLKKKGVDISGIEILPGKTFKWDGRYDEKMADAETLNTELGVFSTFFPKIPQDYRNSEYIFLANIDPTLQEYVLTQVNSPKLTLLDTMNFWLKNKREELIRILPKIDIIVINESELMDLGENSNIEKGSKKVLKMGPKIVVIKRGKAGAILYSEKYKICAPAYPFVDIQDPTGAGDSFAGGFLSKIAMSKRITKVILQEALYHAVVMASFTIEGFSVEKLKKVDRISFLRRLKDYKKLVTF
jgi:sugar/nucleoside kinase (ribokinase family)